MKSLILVLSTILAISAFATERGRPAPGENQTAGVPDMTPAPPGSFISACQALAISHANDNLGTLTGLESMLAADFPNGLEAFKVIVETPQVILDIEPPDVGRIPGPTGVPEPAEGEELPQPIIGDNGQIIDRGRPTAGDNQTLGVPGSPVIGGAPTIVVREFLLIMQQDDTTPH